MLVRHDSDEENKDETGAAETPLSTAFWDMLPHIADFFAYQETRTSNNILVTAFSA